MTGGQGDGRRYYGWRIVAAIFVMMTVSSGLGFYNLSVFLEALTAQRHFSVGLVSGATAYFFVVVGLTGLGVARLIDRFDPRWTIVGGALGAGAGLVAVGRAETVPGLFAAYTVFAAGFSASSLIPGTTLVARWFARRRSVALSLASSGLSVGGIALTPLSAHWINDLGLATGSELVALVYVLGVVPVVALVVRPSPASMGLELDGLARAAGAADPARAGVPYGLAVRSPFFILVTVAWVLAMTTQVGGMAHQFKLVADRLDPAAAAQAVALLAGSSMVGRLIGGWLLQRIAIRPFTIMLMVGQAVALAVLAFGGSKATLLAGSVMFGLTIGNILMLLPLVLAEAFGVRDYGRIYSTSQLAVTVGNAAGPFLIGVLRDVTGGYTGALLAVSGVALLAMSVFAAAGPVPEGAHAAHDRD